jgi:hypothetical protein
MSDEQKQKQIASGNNKLGTQCRPDNLDNAPPGENQANYPSENPQYGYNYETPTHKILVMFADGKHGPNRWDLGENDVGTTEHPQHEHDDFKRLPPTILQDADPRTSRVGFFANFRVPDSRPVLEQPGDQLGLSPADRARKPKGRLDDGI